MTPETDGLELEPLELRAWLEPDRRPEPDRAAELADLADLRATLRVLECGDCRAVYRPDEHHECRQQYRRNARASRLTCPTCKRPGALTAREAARGYQCRACTRRDEGYGF